MENRDIFVSYIEEDGETVRALAAELRALGYTTWTYEEDGIAGLSYLTQVHGAIRASRAFVLVASHGSVRAHQVIREVEQAHELGKQIITVRLGLTHQQFVASDPILGMASGTAVTLSADKDNLSILAKRIASAIPFSPDASQPDPPSRVQTAPTPDCTYTINPTEAAFPATGGTRLVIVSATAGCGWTAVSSDPWITVTAGASGSGNGSVAYTVAANAGAERSGTLTIGGLTFKVTQPSSRAELDALLRMKREKEF